MNAFVSMETREVAFKLVGVEEIPSTVLLRSTAAKELVDILFVGIATGPHHPDRHTLVADDGVTRRSTRVRVGSPTVFEEIPRERKREPQFHLFPFWCPCRIVLFANDGSFSAVSPSVTCSEVEEVFHLFQTSEPRSQNVYKLV